MIWSRISLADKSVIFSCRFWIILANLLMLLVPRPARVLTEVSSLIISHKGTPNSWAALSKLSIVVLPIPRRGVLIILSKLTVSAGLAITRK